nr:hypothetical protein [Tanacetum cinerariifolium]
MNIKNTKKKELQYFEHIANLNSKTSQRSNSFYDDYNDYEESTITLNESISQVPPSISITPILPTEDPEDSLITRDEELDTIPEKELDKFIKSSVEDFVPIPSESEDTAESNNECDLPACDDLSPIDVPEGKSVTFSNPLFNSYDEFTSSDNEPLSDEDVSKDNVKIQSNPLFEFNDEYIYSDTNPLFVEVLEDIENKDHYDYDLDEPALGVTPFSYPYEDECFNLGGGIDNSMIEDKVFHLGIPEKIFSPTYVILPFEDRLYLSLTYIIRIYLSSSIRHNLLFFHPLRVAQIVKTLALVVLSIVHLSMLMESDILDLID